MIDTPTVGGQLPDAARVAAAKGFAVRCVLLGPALYFWNSIYPHPRELIIGILIALPWVGVALLATRPGLFRFDGDRDCPHPNLMAAFATSAGFLIVVAVSEPYLLDWQQLLPWAAIGGALLAFAVRRTAGYRRSHSLTAWLLAAIAAGYGFGLSVAANTYLDRSTTTSYRPAVLSKLSLTSRSSSERLLLEPWGPRVSQDTLSVPETVFDRIRVGDPLCVTVHGGALGARWFSASACENPHP